MDYGTKENGTEWAQTIWFNFSFFPCNESIPVKFEEDRGTLETLGCEPKGIFFPPNKTCENESVYRCKEDHVCIFIWACARKVPCRLWGHEDTDSDPGP